MNTRPTPVRVLTGVSGIAAGGGDHSCAVLTNGGVRCWGYNRDGQLGDGMQMSTALPGAVIAP
jgi:alpha-tubulin suppressor-like RCC1 family protein